MNIELRQKYLDLIYLSQIDEDHLKEVMNIALSFDMLFDDRNPIGKVESKVDLFD